MASRHLKAVATFFVMPVVSVLVGRLVCFVGGFTDIGADMCLMLFTVIGLALGAIVASTVVDGNW